MGYKSTSFSEESNRTAGEDGGRGSRWRAKGEKAPRAGSKENFTPSRFQRIRFLKLPDVFVLLDFRSAARRVQHLAPLHLWNFLYERRIVYNVLCGADSLAFGDFREDKKRDRTLRDRASTYQSFQRKLKRLCRIFRVRDIILFSSRISISKIHFKDQIISKANLTNYQFVSCCEYFVRR